MEPPAARHEAPLVARAALLIALLAVVARLLPLALLGPERYAGHGYLYYAEMADNLRAGEGLHRTMPYGQGDKFAIRTPGYPLLLAGLKSLPGDLTGLVALAGALFGAASAVICAWLAGRAFGRKAGLVAGIAVALWPHACVHDGAMQDTALYSALLLGLVALVQVARDRATSSAGLALAAACGLVAAAGVLVRVTLLLPAVALAAWLAWTAAAPFARRLVLAGVMLATLGAGLAPWLARNARVVGAPVLTSDAGRSLWLGNNPQTFSVYPRQSIDRSEERAWAALDQAERVHVRSLSGDEIAQDAWFRAKALEWMREHPAAVVAGFARKVAATFSPWMSPRAAAPEQAVHFLCWGVVLVAAGAAAWRHRRRAAELAPLLLPVALLAVHSGVFFGHSAYRAYADALALVLAADTAARLLGRVPVPAGLGRLERARIPIAAFALALAVRLALVAVAGELWPPEDPWARGYEVGAAARAVAEGRGLADPFGMPSGPTAAVGPLVPFLLAIPARVFGPLSPEAWRAFPLLAVLASALVAPLLFRLGARLLGPLAGTLAAFGWALHPIGCGSVLGWVSTAVFGLLVVGAVDALADLESRLGRGEAGAGRAALALGAWLGAGLWQEPLLLPFAGLWALARTALLARRRAGRATALPALALATAALIAVPWVARNAVVVGTPSLRSWAGPELWLGARTGPGETPALDRHPSRSLREMQHLRELGEAAYAREKLREAVTLVRERPGRWLAACAARYGELWWGRPSWWSATSRHPILRGPLSALRGATFLLPALLAWAGLALAWRRVPFARWLALLLALYPVTYAMTHVEARYRLPLEPLLLLSACLGAVILFERRRAARADRAEGPAAS